MASMETTVELIRARRAQIDPVRFFLTILAAPLFALGWSARKVVVAIWWLMSYAIAGVQVGWKAAAPTDERLMR